MNPDLSHIIKESSLQSAGQRWTKWTKECRARATQEGWYLWFYSDHRTGYTLAQIRAKGKNEPKWKRRPKIAEDRPVRYVTDLEANLIVGQLADAGAEHAKFALAIIAKCVINMSFA